MTTVPTAQNLTTDAVIVGAGLAGLSAEYALRGTGLRVQLLEADEQIGGRTRGEYWPAAGRHIDLGASWLTDEFRHARKFASTFGLALVETPAPTRHLTHCHTGITQQQFLSQTDVTDLVRANEQILAAIEAAVDEPLTVQDALEQVPMSPVAREWHLAMQRYLSGARLDRVDAHHLLLPMDDLENPEHYGVEFANTMQDLVNGFAHGIEADLELATPVQAVREHEGGYVVETSAGRSVRAKHVVLAVPLNVLQDIDLAPADLEPLTPFVADGHAGACRKDWFVLRGVDQHTRVFAATGLFGYFRTAVRLGQDRMLAVGLAPSAEGTPTLAEFGHQIQQYLPTAQIEDHFSFDWSEHPWAQGTWVAPPPGFYPALEELAATHRQLHLVGGDISNTFPGTVEGAIETGLNAAANIHRAEQSHR